MRWCWISFSRGWMPSGDQPDKKGGRPPACFLVMSNTDNPVIEQSALEAGAAYYFLKPFDSQLMAERIQAITAQRRHPLHALARPAEPEGGSLAMQVTEIFRQIGIPASLNGYNFLRTAILMAIEDESLVPGHHQTPLSRGGP